MVRWKLNAFKMHDRWFVDMAGAVFEVELVVSNEL